MTIALESMAVSMPEVEGHPNRAAFRGVLTVVDLPSQRAPSGSGGRRVILTKRAAEAALPSLLGMALDYAPSFDRHDVRRKVGVITSADVVGRNLEVGGYLFAKDFPEIVTEIAKYGRSTAETRLQTPDDGSRGSVFGVRKELHSEGARLRASLAAAVQRIRNFTGAMLSDTSDKDTLRAFCPGTGGPGAGGLGMSFEVTNVLLETSRSSVWTLMEVTFTGAAILRKDKAAFQDTWIGLSK